MLALLLPDFLWILRMVGSQMSPMAVVLKHFLKEPGPTRTHFLKEQSIRTHQALQDF